jgi:hypothetical protein
MASTMIAMASQTTTSKPPFAHRKEELAKAPAKRVWGWTAGVLVRSTTSNETTNRFTPKNSVMVSTMTVTEK